VIASADLHSLAADYRGLLASVEAFRDDHTPGAIYRRAARAARVNAQKSRRWKARAIGLNPEPLHNAIALSGMAPMMWEERWHLAVALPQPNPVGGLTDPAQEVVLIDPATNQAHVMGDLAAKFIAPLYHRDRLNVLTDPKAWAREIALDRLEWYSLRAQRRAALQAEPTWTGDIPAALLFGSPKAVRWSDFDAKVIDVPADMRVSIRNAMLNQARLPRIQGRA
jgi:hypothetical protein